MKTERTILWVLLAFVVGFTLPVCSCLGSSVILFNALGRMAGDVAPTMGTGDAVAVIQLNGTITSGPADYLSTGITPDLVSDLLDRAAADPTVKAVVLQINSPGGSVVASNEIYHTIQDFDLPVVVWMGEMAASGGYYISCGADQIVAHPDSLVGSIGVISQFINAEALLDEVGVDVTVITSGENKDIGSLFRDMTEEEEEIWQEISDEIYDGFVAIVAEARDLSLDEVYDLATGQVYTGRQALALGLVDMTGTSGEAITQAADLAGISGTPRVVEIEVMPTFFDTLMGFQSSQSFVPTMEEVLGWIDAPSVEYRFASP